DAEGWNPSDPVLIALGYGNNGELEELGSFAPALEVPYTNLMARGKRAFLSGYGKLEVISSDDELSSKVHDLRSYQCSSLEVADDQALCALGEFGVQAIPLD